MRRSGKSGRPGSRRFLPLTLTELFRSRTLHSINPHTLITNHAARESLPSPSPRPSPLAMCTRFLTRILHSLRLRKRPAATISVCTRAENVFHGSHWGHESDENDETWLWLGFLFESNTEGVRLSEAGKKGEHCAARDVPTMYLLADRRLPSWLLPSAAFYFDLEAAFQTTPPLGVITWLVKEGRSCRKESSAMHPRAQDGAPQIDQSIPGD